MWNRRNLLRAGGATVAGGAAVAVLPGISHGSTSRRRRDRWETLRGRLTGRLVLPSDEGYDLSRQSHYAMYDTVRPQAVAQCETTADVQECVRFATEQGIPLRVRSGGHNFAGWSIGEGLVVDLFRMKNVSVTPGGSTVHVGPGSTSIETISALEPHGLQLPTGTCPTVAPGGFLTGGGIGHQTRKFGLGSDRLVSARVVLADGRAVLASEREHPDLFWALAGGGGGNYGIVTDFELRPVDAPSMVFYQSMWSVDRAPEVLAAWQRWIADAPDDLGSMIALVRPPGGAAPLVAVSGGYLGAPDAADAVLAGLADQAGFPPLFSSAEPLAYGAAMRRVFQCDVLTTMQCQREGTNPDAQLPRGGFQQDAFRLFRRPLTVAEAESVVSAWAAGADDGQSRVVQGMALGGRFGRTAARDTAFWHRDAGYVLGFVSQHYAPTAPERETAAEWVRAGGAVIDPLSSGGYVNFPSTELRNWQTKYYGGNYPRLRSVKRSYDFSNVFRHPRSVGS